MVCPWERKRSCEFQFSIGYGTFGMNFEVAKSGLHLTGQLSRLAEINNQNFFDFIQMKKGWYILNPVNRAEPKSTHFCWLKSLIILQGHLVCPLCKILNK
jgi:hypothetical protein